MVGIFKKFLNATLVVAFCFFWIQKISAQPVVSDVSATSTRNTAALNWIGMNEDGVAAVNFNYGETEGYGQTSTVKVTQTTGGMKYYFSTALKNLTPGKKYFYQIVLHDYTGASGYYLGSFETAAPDLTPPKISAVGSAIQNESATISWITNEEANSIVYYYPLGGEEKSKILDSLTTDHFVYLGELKPNTEYRYRVASADASGNLSKSDELTFKSGKAILPPSDVSNLRLTVIGESTFSITWKNPTVNFDHVRVVRTGGVPAVSPDDGVVVYEGRDEKLIDKPDHLPAHHYYTVYSYNAYGDYSGGAAIDCPFVKHGIEEKKASVSASQKISISDFSFFSAHREKPILMVNNTVAHNPGANFSITIPTKVLPFIPQLMFIKIDGGVIHQFYPEGTVFVTDFKFPSAGEHEVYIEVDYANGLIDVIPFKLNSGGTPVVEVEAPKIVVVEPTVKPVVKAPPSSFLGIEETATVIKNIAKSEEVQQTVSEVVAPTIVGVATFSSITAISWVNILPFLQLLAQPFAYLGGRRRGSGWGQVYNSFSKTPVDLAVVRLINKDSGKVVQSKVTDSQGRYAFVVNQGKYALQILKAGFIFPSQTLKKVNEDGSRKIYHGEIIEVAGPGTLIAANIPVDPAGQHQMPMRMVWKSSLRRLQVSISWIGLAVIIFSLVISPRWYTWILLAVQIFSILMLRHVSKQQGKQKNWGVIYDEKTKKPLDHVFTRLFNAEFNKLAATQVTDANGRFFFLAGDGEYYITCERAGYAPKKTEIINLK